MIEPPQYALKGLIPPSYYIDALMERLDLDLQDPEFLGDMDILLRTDAPRFEPAPAWDLVKRTFVDRMPGKRD